MQADLATRLRRWQEAGLIDAATAAAIAAWESERAGGQRLTLPVRLAIGLGAVLLAAGLLLFVSAHWDALAPAVRFLLLLTLVLALHGGGAISAGRLGSLSIALHALGTVALGGGVFLAGQIFHLEAHWPTGLLLWASGAGLGWLLLRQWPQLALLALIAPAWLASEWLLACRRALAAAGGWSSAEPAAVALVPAAGLLLVCLAYLAAAPSRSGSVGSDGSAGSASSATDGRQVLLWLGGLGVLPATAVWTLATVGAETVGRFGPGRPPAALPVPLALLGWLVVLGGPLLLAGALAPGARRPLAVAIGWMLIGMAGQGATIGVFTYAWSALGGVLLMGWGAVAARAERINLGAAQVGLIVLVFYFSEVMGRLGRSASLIGLGVLFLAGGWGLERLRRRLVRRSRTARHAGAAGP